MSKTQGHRVKTTKEVQRNLPHSETRRNPSSSRCQFVLKTKSIVYVTLKSAEYLRLTATSLLSSRMLDSTEP